MPCYKFLVLGLFLLCCFNAHAQFSRQWVSQQILSGNESRQEFTSQVTDRQQNIITATFNGIYRETYHIALTKHTTKGQKLWSSVYQDEKSKWDQPVGLKTDREGNIYLLGWSQLTDNDGTFFIAKYTADGNKAWSRPVGRKHMTRHSFVVSETGEVYATGSKNESIGESSRIFKFNTTGEEAWSTDFIGSDGKGGNPTALALDGNGSLLVGGSLSESVTGSPQQHSARLLKLNAQTGAKTFTGNYISDDVTFKTDYETLNQVLVAESGNTYLVTQRNGLYLYQVLLYKVSEAGELKFTKAVGATDESTYMEVVLSRDEQVTLLGKELKYRDIWDYFLTAFNSSGQRQYYHKYNEYNQQTFDIKRVVPSDLGLSPSGVVAVTGYRDVVQRPPTWLMDPIVIQPARATTILYNTTGSPTWTETRRDMTDEWEEGFGLDFTSDRSFYLSGRQISGENLVISRYTNCNDFAVSASQNKTICAGGEVKLEAAVNSGEATFSWSPATGLSAANVSNPVASPSQTTTYTVTATNAEGCTATAQVTVNVSAVPTVSITASSATSFCQGGSVELTAAASTATSSYQWFRNGDEINGATSSRLLVNSSGAYKVRVSNGSCSETSAVKEVSVLASITDNIILRNQNICSGGSAAAIVGETPKGGNGTYTYQWQRSTNGTSFTDIAGATTKNYEAGALQSTTWFRRLVTSGSCTSTSEPVRITVNPMPVVSLSTFEQTCHNAAAFTLSGGLPAGGTYLGKGVVNGKFHPGEAGPGIHTITYTYTSPEGCTASASQNINVTSCSVTSIDENELKVPVSIYPNPTNGRVSVEVEFASGTDATLRLTDLSGRVIYTKVYQKQLKLQESLLLKTEPRGVYLLQLITKDGAIQRKIVLH